MMLLVLWENGKSSVKKKRKCEMSNQPPPYISQLQCQPPRLLAENSRKYVFLRRKKKVNFNIFFPSALQKLEIWAQRKCSSEMLQILQWENPRTIVFHFIQLYFFPYEFLEIFFWNPTPLFHFMKWFLTILFDDVIKPNWFILLFKSIILLCTWKCNFSVFLLNY